MVVRESGKRTLICLKENRIEKEKQFVPFGKFQKFLEIQRVIPFQERTMSEVNEVGTKLEMSENNEEKRVIVSGLWEMFLEFERINEDGHATVKLFL